MTLKSSGFFLAFLPLTLAAQTLTERTVVPLRDWPAPRHWQKSESTEGAAAPRPEFQQPGGISNDVLVFVPLAPCRLADTRSGSGYPALGSTPLAALTPRTLPVIGSCGLPNNYTAAEAYSLNVTVVPPSGTPGGYVVVYPNPATPVPLVASLSWNPGAAYQTGAVITADSPDGSVNVVARFPTDVVIDINGYYASASNSFGNMGLGSGALGSETSGNFNTAIGDAALLNDISGISNTALGFEALAHNTTGSNNTAVGYQAGDNLTTGSNNIMIGNAGTSSDDQTIRIGNSQTSAYMAGILGNSLSGAATVVIDSNGQLGVQPVMLSSRRYKEDVRDMGDASAGLLKLRPVTFRYKKAEADGSKPLEYGLIAEEVAEVYPELVVRGKDGQVETVEYAKLPAMLVNELQKQNETIRKLEARLATLEAQLATSTAKATPAKALSSSASGR